MDTRQRSASMHFFGNDAEARDAIDQSVEFSRAPQPACKELVDYYEPKDLNDPDYWDLTNPENPKYHYWNAIADTEETGL